MILRETGPIISEGRNHMTIEAIGLTIAILEHIVP